MRRIRGADAAEPTFGLPFPTHQFAVRRGARLGALLFARRIMLLRAILFAMTGMIFCIQYGVDPIF